VSKTEIITIDYRDLATLIVRDKGIRNGYWGAFFRFGLAGANAGPDPESLVPAAIVGIQEVGIQRFDEPNNLTVDAAKVWVKPAGTRRQLTTSRGATASRKTAAKRVAKPRR